MRTYAVIGAGGIGGLYGARLAAAGHDVQFVLRSDAAHVRAHGLRLDSPDGDVHLRDVRVVEDVAALDHVDVALVALKTTAPEVLDAMIPTLATVADGVVLLQNGFGNEERFVAAGGDDVDLAAGLCFVCSAKVGPGHIEHQDYGLVTLAGWTPAGSEPGGSDFVAGVEADFAAAKIPVMVQPDLRQARWRKLVWNVPFNGLSVVLRAGTAELLADPSSRALVADLMAEVVAASVADGHPVDAGFAEQMLANTEKMAPYLPSMRLDFDAGRPMEIDAIYGHAIAAAEAAGIEVPLMRTVERQLRFLDQASSPVERPG